MAMGDTCIGPVLGEDDEPDNAGELFSCADFCGQRCRFCDGPLDGWWCIDFCDAFSDAMEMDDDA